MRNPVQTQQKGTTMSVHPTAIDKEAKLHEMLTHLDRTHVVLEQFGCFVALSQDRETLFACPMNTDGTADRDADDPLHMNWAEVTAPEPEFVKKANSVFGTSFDPNTFSGR
jgi:hypothetical protein